jgi:hypothetical protein
MKRQPELCHFFHQVAEQFDLHYDPAHILTDRGPDLVSERLLRATES